MRPRSSGRSSIFEGQSVGRLYDDWDAWTLSPEFETRYAFRLTRARARWVARNNELCVGFLDELANNVVGANGIRLHAQIKNALGKPAKATNQEIERAWEEWSLPEYASADGHDSWVELQRQTIQGIATDGEVFIRRIKGFPSKFGYALQLVDPDLVDESYNVARLDNGNRIVMGVEVDRWNRPVAYHVWNRYAEDMNGIERKREPISADDMLHLFVRWHRSNIPRGISWFAPVLGTIRHANEYEFNHLVGSRAAASKMAFILNKQPQAIENFEPPKKGEKPRYWEVEPATIAELYPGQELAEWDPAFPNVQYGDFIMAIDRKVARGLKTSYMTLTGDLRQANYSSQRAGLIPERDRWRGLQTWDATHGHRVIYNDWIDSATLFGAVAVDSRLGSDFRAVAWHGRGWKWVDPKNDLEAAKLEIDLGLNSRTNLHADRGTDYEDTVDDLADEETYAEEKDVDVSGNQMSGVSPATVSPEGVSDEGNPNQGGEDKAARHLAAV